MPSALALLSSLDWVALGVLLVIWQGISFVIEHETERRPSVYILMQRYRREWLRQMVTREPRIFDAQVLSALQQTAAFFSSACLLALGGGIALLGQAERAAEVFAGLSGEVASPTVWQEKLIVVLAILTIALLRFIWSVRLYGYQAVVMAAVPNEPGEAAYREATRAATLHINAARSFTRGLRALYFSIACLVWLVGAVPMLVAIALTAGVLIRREWFSESREALL